MHSTQQEISLVWFRQDLRLEDNPAYDTAIKAGEIIPVFIFDDCAPEDCKMGTASRAWLHASLTSLNRSLKGNLQIFVGSAPLIIQKLLNELPIKKVVWNTCYEPWHQKQAAEVATICSVANVDHQAFNGNFLWSPEKILKDDGTYYRVFTAYKNKAHRTLHRSVTPQSKITPRFFSGKDFSKESLAALDLISNRYTEAHKNFAHEAGETSAKKKLTHFIAHQLNGYKEGRDYPSNEHTSHLSAHLHFGEISPVQIMEALKDSRNNADAADTEHFISELIWREFSTYLLSHFPTLPTENMIASFNHFMWDETNTFLSAWQRGETGYPLIDAGMRELAQTGFMHNRVRMAVASFLVKNLNIHWHRGRDWFWEHLADADLANNSVNWQWVAGCGVDAAPYFRIFNPITQGEKFDKMGEYTKKFVPELAALPSKYLFKPWSAPEQVLRTAGVTLGKNYPAPIVDLATTRNKALAQYYRSHEHTR